jgi:DHA3 family macrolide efflux protein-like MFS transporter
VLTAIVAIVTIAAIHVPQPPNNVKHKESSVLKDMAEGFRFLKGWPGALRLMLIAMIMNFTLSPAMSLLPILASVFFNGDASTLATLQSAIAIGIFTGGIFISVWGGTKKRIHTSLGGAFFLGAGFLIIGFITPNDFWIAVAVFLFVGFMASIANGPLSAIFQATIPPEMQGRVFSVLSSGTSMMMPIGLAFAGPIADFFGLQFMFIVAGLVTAVAAIMAFFSKPLMEIEDKHRKDSDAESIQ